MPDYDIITNFCTALVTKFKALVADAHNNFYNAIQGQLFKGRAPEGTGYPYSVYFVVNQNSDRTFTEDHRDLLVQFSHFSSKSSSSEAELINAYCNNLYDEGTTFTITGATLVWMKMMNSPGAQPEDHTTPQGTFQVWHCPTDFDVKVSMD